MAQTFGFMVYVLGLVACVLDLGLGSQVLGLGLGLVVYVLGLAICVLHSITSYSRPGPDPAGYEIVKSGTSLLISNTYTHTTKHAVQP